MQTTCVFCYRVASDADSADQVAWDTDFAVGSVVDASVHEQKDYGLILDFASNVDVLGLAAKHQVSAIASVAYTQYVDMTYSGINLMCRCCA